MFDSDPQATFGYVIKALNDFNLGYIHLMEPNEIDLNSREVINPVLPVFRSLYQGNIITNGGYNKETGETAIASENAELVSFGKPYLANPDLVKRFSINAELNEPNPRTFYGRGNTEDAKVGYTDYSFL
jgi:N-ethylmaleimide reductase